MRRWRSRLVPDVATRQPGGKGTGDVTIVAQITPRRPVTVI
jgi:hypothetical protein